MTAEKKPVKKAAKKPDLEKAIAEKIVPIIKEAKITKLNTKAARRLPKRVNILGILNKPQIVIIEANA